MKFFYLKLLLMLLTCVFVAPPIYCLASIEDVIIQKSDTIILSSKKDDFAAVINKIKGKAVVSLKNDGIYEVSQAISISSNIEILGNGSVIRPALEWSKYNEDDSPFISFIGVTGGGLKDVTIDFRGDKRNMQNRVSSGILILASSNVIIKNNTFKNGGLAKDAKSIPNSPYVIVASQDIKGEVASVPKAYAHVLGNSSYNIISGNKMLNLNTETRFGVRVVTNWLSKRSRQDFKFNASNNVIEKNTFTGDFIWNTVEIAGGGSIKNKVVYNTVDGKAVNNLDIDKGASYNEISYNNIVNAGLSPRYKNDKNVRCSPIMVQGMASRQYKGVGNIVRNNQIANVSNPPSNNTKYFFSSGIGISCADNTLVKNNVLLNLYQDGNYKKGEDYGYGIIVHDDCEDVKILNNQISNVYTAIGTNLNKDKKINLSVEDNKLYEIKVASKLSPANSKLDINGKNIVREIKIQK